MPTSINQERERASSDQVCDLTDAVLILTEQVRMLRLAVDEIGEELGWAIRTRVLDRLPPPSPARITSLPLDPLAENFHEHINAVTPADLPADELPVSSATIRRRQSHFW